MSSSAYPHLLSQLTVGHLTLPNRVVMGSMHTGLEDRTHDLPKLAAYFAERAKGGTALMITGGYAPSWRGWLTPAGSLLATRRNAYAHRTVTDAVHENGPRILLQVLHAGRYAYHPLSHSASARRSPITPFTPRAMSSRDVERTVDSFARAAELAKVAGYDGVEVMGSEGYLINQFLTSRTNERTDAWGGSASKRMRFAEEIVRRTRESVVEDFAIVYRMSLLDLVEDAQSWDETVELAQRVEAAGASLINTGIGWHESRIPTIVTSVPRAAFSWVTAKLRPSVSIPLMASNRINAPEVAERILADGEADLVSMARPLLADPAFVRKAEQNRAGEINTCIACNQACLDHAFAKQPVSCLVNPRAGRETELFLLPVPTPRRKRIAVVGAGPAGLASATALAGRGHAVDLFEGSAELGGQFRLAMAVPGKAEFAETLRYYTRRLETTGVRVHTSRRVGAEDLLTYDDVVLSTGVVPRMPPLPGIDHPSVVSYADLLSGRRGAGERVAVIGAGGIGFDVCEWLVAEPHESRDDWMKRWGVTDPAEERGGLATKAPPAVMRTVHLLQRKETPHGAGLGRTTGWVHRATLRDAGVRLLGGVSYDRIDDAGLHVRVAGEARLLEVDSVVVCAGQESVRELVEPLTQAGVSLHVIGGADVAAELDAKRAIRQGTELAARL